MLAQFIYDTENWFYKKKFQNFFNFFQFLGHPSLYTQKDFFALSKLLRQKSYHTLMNYMITFLQFNNLNKMGKI